MALKTALGQAMLLAYREALQTRKPNDFTVVGLASLLIRLEGRDGRLAVNDTKREITPNSAVLGSPRKNQGADPKKSVRLTFPKQEEEMGEAALETATKFGLRRVGATQEGNPNESLPDNHLQSLQNKSENSGHAADSFDELKAEVDYWKAKALAIEKIEPDPEEPQQKTGNTNLPELKDSPPPPPAKAEQKPAEPEPSIAPNATPLSEAEQDLVKTMKPGGVGREFGLERLRATLTVIGIEWSGEHSATVLAGALLKHLNQK